MQSCATRLISSSRLSVNPSFHCSRIILQARDTGSETGMSTAIDASTKLRVRDVLSDSLVGLDDRDLAAEDEASDGAGKADIASANHAPSLPSLLSSSV